MLLGKVLVPKSKAKTTAKVEGGYGNAYRHRSSRVHRNTCMQNTRRNNGVAAILAIDTRPEMPNHRRVYHHQLDLQTDDLKPVFEGANSLIHLATSFGPSSDGMDAGGAEIDATRRVFEAASAVGIKKIVLLSSAMVYGHGRQTKYQ